MNVKKFFYHDYYRGIDFSLKAIKKEDLTTDDKKAIEKEEGKFKTRNGNLYAFTPDLGFVNQYLSHGLWTKEDEILLWTTYPGLFTGSGYTHETGIKNELMLGFFFDHTTGMPLLAGSSVKGVLRSVFPQFKGQDKNSLLPDEDGKKDKLKLAKVKFVATLFKLEEKPELIHQLELAIFENVDVAASLAKPDDLAKGKLAYLPAKQHDVFHDAFIQATEAPGGCIFGEDVITPHTKGALKNPIPLPFLKVLPDVRWAFPMVLQATSLTEGQVIDAQMKQAVFAEILCTVGVGAKTNVGYGQLLTNEDYKKSKLTQADIDAMKAREKAEAEAAKKAIIPPKWWLKEAANPRQQLTVYGQIEALAGVALEKESQKPEQKRKKRVIVLQNLKKGTPIANKWDTKCYSLPDGAYVKLAVTLGEKKEHGIEISSIDSIEIVDPQNQD